LDVLAVSECVTLLTRHHFGRLAFWSAPWPVVLPVNYVFEEPSLVIRTAPGTKLEWAPGSAVAFEVDDADPAGTWGWSVLVQGPAFDITEATDSYSVRLRELGVTPWAPGHREHWLKVSALEVSGRRFGPVPPA
jgi:nitroimidazol reductase NimA-like FMN-containing flavoprotein (pyridoxamine 5'-phosphate oxidase superfamily)